MPSLPSNSTIDNLLTHEYLRTSLIKKIEQNKLQKFMLLNQQKRNVDTYATRIRNKTIENLITSNKINDLEHQYKVKHGPKNMQKARNHY
jgi:hypothetical protein